jgi:hypothetical protein
MIGCFYGKRCKNAVFVVYMGDFYSQVERIHYLFLDAESQRITVDTRL